MRRPGADREEKREPERDSVVVRVQWGWDLERGRRNPTVVSLYELAQALDVGPVDLIKPQRRRPAAKRRA
jgi:transcriptional regulator with XRE-family HTH domain